MNILLISHSTARTGGGEDDFLRLVFKLKQKHKLFGILPEGINQRELSKHFEDCVFVKKNIFPFTKLSSPISYLRFFKYARINNRIIRKFVSQKEYDICYLNSSVLFSQIYPLLSLRKPIVLTIREIIKPPILRKCILHFLNKYVSKIIVISEHMKQLVQKNVNQNKVELIYSSVEIDEINKVKFFRISHKDRKVFKIICIGVISHNKGQHILINSLKKLDSNEEIEVDFVGRVVVPSYYDKLVEMIRNVNINSRVIFSGECDRIEVYRKIVDADIVVVSSLEEGQSLVLLESLLLNKVVITSKVGMSQEVVSHGVNGFIYPPGNSDKLSEYLGLLIKDRSILTDLEKHSNDLIDYRFDVNRNLDRYEAILINQKP